ncbi:hypothetical protein ADIWIN_2300 [Winogradskyella psychrotolerans RS-3]|uniref:Uncharacterized protein n=1 Tax=Winogradskyella psychrotolerans RS-3 TaxID=641526 RepID=S7VTM2_9FLAO|nr:hypothetical protein [Winogradskyella psychrotolerans]EPR72687.1 hypothetical protein ADIWIN_2300 [Winogradskyella psychrotolerans RS-3]
MIKNISTLLVLLLTSISFGQNIILLQNTNPKAKELKHSLNSTKDSLMLGCDSKILKVEIFNENYEQLIIVEANNTKISLKDIPNGNFIIETRIDEKIIVMDLIKHDDYNDTSNSGLYHNMEQIIEGKGMMLDEELKVIKSSPNKSIEFILTGGKAKNHSAKNQKYFWTETQIINESGSSKTMRLADQKSVDKMIHRHKLEINSDSGKLNKLTVWEVYNKGEFMENQVSNPEFVYSSSTDLYNHIPYYSTTNNIQNL